MFLDPSPADLITTIVSLSCHNAPAKVVGRHNVSNLIYVPLTVLNASADSTAIVCNYMPMNQCYIVSTWVGVP